MRKETFRILVSILLVGGVFTLLNRQSVSMPQQTKSSDIAVECNRTTTPQLTEGPYYKAGSPMRTNLTEEGVVGEVLTITGYVYDTSCNPVAGAWLDFWQADGNGVYDNSGYKLRGHQFTQRYGKYVLETVIPGEYPGRTPHIHVKIAANEQSPAITSQLFFPDKSQNQKDNIFNPKLLIEIKDTKDGKQGEIDFVIN